MRAQTTREADAATEAHVAAMEAFTFHAFAMRLVREFGNHIGLPAWTRPLGTAAQLEALQEVINEIRPARLYSPAHPTYELRNLASVIQDAKQEGVTPAALADWAAKVPDEETPLQRIRREKLRDVAAVYERYLTDSRARSRFDFDDYILLALDLLSDAAIVQEMRGRYDYVMVDEYQDTSQAQARLVEAVSGTSANLFVVADDDQSIYKFRGASRHNVVHFRQRYPNAVTYRIRENRRSTPQIVRESQAVLAGRPFRESKDLEAVKASGPKVRLLGAVDMDSEALAVADQILAGHAQGIHYRSFAVLARTRVHLNHHARALRERGIPFHFPASRDFFRRREVKDAIAMLRAALDPTDDVAMLRLMSCTTYALGTARLSLAHAAREADSSVWSISRDNSLSLTDAERVNLPRLLEDIRELALLKDSASALEVLHAALERSRYVGLVDGEPLRQLQGAATLRKLVQLVERFGQEDDDPSLERCLNHLALLEASEDEDEVPQPQVELEAVHLSTVHAAKGLEFPHVFVVELMRNQFPFREIGDELELPSELVYREEALPPDPHEEEERRLFYVAMTRAMETLTISYAGHYFSTPAERSGFLDRLIDHDDVRTRLAPAAALAVPAPLEAPPYAIHLDELSFSHLDTFRRCPRRFAFRYYYGYPERAGAEALFGQLLHESLYQGAVRRKQGQTVGGAQLAVIYEEVWAHASFDKRKFADLHEYGAKILATYGETTAWRDAEFEYIEHRFTGLRVGPRRMRGQIDRLDQASSGPAGLGPPRRKLVDYKSGRPKTLDNISFDDRLQLALYAQAAQEFAGGPVQDLELHFLQDASVVTVALDERNMSKAMWAAEQRANDIYEAIKSRQFPTKASAFNCRPCPFRLVCDEGINATADEPGTISEPDPLGPDEIPY